MFGIPQATQIEGILDEEIRRFGCSDALGWMKTGKAYYVGSHDILKRERKAIGKGGAVETIRNLPNNRLVDNRFARLVDQKSSYLCAKPMSFQSESREYAKALGGMFGAAFGQTLLTLAKDALIYGAGWLFPYLHKDGRLGFRRLDPCKLIPFWKDEAHCQLDSALYVFERERYAGSKCVREQRVEWIGGHGIRSFRRENGRLVEDTVNAGHFSSEAPEGRRHFRWTKTPLIAFRASGEEMPLIRRVKGLQDALNEAVSDFQNRLQEDARNTLLILKNYDGTDLAEFRHNLAAYGAVKVKTIDGAGGGVEALHLQTDVEGYKSLIAMLEQGILVNGAGFDARHERLGGSPNQMAIMTMYSDIDLDASRMEAQFQNALGELLWYANASLAIRGEGDFFGTSARAVFNRDMLMNESEIMGSLKDLGLKISNYSLLEQVPWVTNVEQELARLEAEGGGLGDDGDQYEQLTLGI